MAAEALEQAMLEGKDKDQLLAIAQALGIKTNARVAKATLIAKILETTGAGSVTAPASGGGKDKAAKEEADTDAGTDTDSPAEPAGEVVLGPDGEPLADWEIDLVRSGEIEPMSTPAGRAAADDDDDEDDDDGDDDGPTQGESRNARRRRRRGFGFS